MWGERGREREKGGNEGKKEKEERERERIRDKIGTALTDWVLRQADMDDAGSLRKAVAGSGVVFAVTNCE